MDEFEGKLVGGRYRVRHLLGVGGSASVYEAEDTSFGRIVALKIPHENVGPDSLAAKRLVREARASGAVGHPNVCQISEIGRLPKGGPFVVMERLIGETLRDRITNAGRLPFEDAVDIMMQILSGLGAAHERGIIHRDVKPENIFLSQRAGCPALVKILDFGLVSTDALAKEELTGVGSVVGTPYYVAPEHIRGVRDCDPRADLYSCGVVLYEATSGRRPFTASSTAELFRAILTGSPTSVADLRRETPPELVRVIEIAMSRSPSDRFANAGAFQKGLAGVPVGPPTALSLQSFKTGDAQQLPHESSGSLVSAANSPSSDEKTRIEGGAKKDSSSGGSGSKKNEHVDNGVAPAVSKDRQSESALAQFELPPTTIEVEIAKSDEWDPPTEWDQPTQRQSIDSVQQPTTRKKPSLGYSEAPTLRREPLVPDDPPTLQPMTPATAVKQPSGPPSAPKKHPTLPPVPSKQPLGVPRSKK
jgi:serine/threonine protein kinase